MLRNKKGQTGIEEVFYVLAYLFGAALFIFIIYYAYGQIKTPVADALIDATPDGEATFNYTSQASNITGGIGLLNTLFPFLLLGLIIATAISAMFIQSHPVFFFVSLIIFCVIILLGVVFSNVYQQITEDSIFGDTENNFSIMNLFMKYLPFVMAVIVLIVVIVLFGKSGTNTGGQL